MTICTFFAIYNFRTTLYCVLFLYHHLYQLLFLTHFNICFQDLPTGKHLLQHVNVSLIIYLNANTCFNTCLYVNTRFNNCSHANTCFNTNTCVNTYSYSNFNVLTLTPLQTLVSMTLLKKVFIPFFNTCFKVTMFPCKHLFQHLCSHLQILKH